MQDPARRIATPSGSSIAPSTAEKLAGKGKIVSRGQAIYSRSAPSCRSMTGKYHPRAQVDGFLPGMIHSDRTQSPARPRPDTVVLGSNRQIHDQGSMGLPDVHHQSPIPETSGYPIRTARPRQPSAALPHPQGQVAPHRCRRISPGACRRITFIEFPE